MDSRTHNRIRIDTQRPRKAERSQRTKRGQARKGKPGRHQDIEKGRKVRKCQNMQDRDISQEQTQTDRTA